MSGSLKTHRFTVRLTSDDFVKLSVIADREGFNTSTIVRHLILPFLKSTLTLGGL